MKYSYAIVLTGSIATGKSSVASVFSDFGFDIIDADQIAHEVLDEEVDQIVELFGEQYRLASGVDRKALGTLVFSDKKKREILESHLHPLIQKKIENLSEELDKLKKPYLIDIPLFFEFERYNIASSIVVYAPVDIQLHRLMDRDGFSKEQAQKRISSQIDIEIKKAKATYVIDNSRDKEHLQDECMRVKELILEKYTV